MATPLENYNKASSKSSCTFTLLKKMERAGGVEVDGTVGCHVTSQQDKPVDLAVKCESSYEAANMSAKLENCTEEEQ
jgi:hypothetical protein